jgi:hypothetical protein
MGMDGCGPALQLVTVDLQRDRGSRIAVQRMMHEKSESLIETLQW